MTPPNPNAREYLESAPGRRRQQTLQAAIASPLDLLIIGGGIVGAGIARDAAMRGLRATLVEQHDFAFGTSSRSSRLLHGGLRYLAQGRIGLVHEASVEKKVIHQIAPHLAEPLPFVFPTYLDNPHWVLWQLKIGVKIYDLLCGGRNLGRSTWLSREEVTRKVPGLTPENLTGAVRYYDGFTNDARLTIDSLRSAAAHGALVLNYCRFLDSRRDSSLWACEAEDCLANNRITLQARAVVNATGPWAEALPHSQVKLRLTKGIHLVIDRGRLSVPETVVMSDEKRILFAIPWGERTILGTTDTDFQGSLDDVTADNEDVAYVLRIANRFFPGAHLAAADVISVWAGLRPLIADSGSKPSDISRSHQIRSPEPGWWDVAGGKLTTYRLMAEQTVDRVVRALANSHSLKHPVAPCQTATQPLLPVSETEGSSSVLPPDVSRAVVDHVVNREWAVHLDDVMIRRTSWHYYLQDARQTAAKVADWMAEKLGWSGATHDVEMERYESAAPIPAERIPAVAPGVGNGA